MAAKEEYECQVRYRSDRLGGALQLTLAQEMTAEDWFNRGQARRKGI